MDEKIRDLLERIRGTAADLGETAAPAARYVGQRAGELVDTAKLNIQIFDRNGGQRADAPAEAAAAPPVEVADEAMFFKVVRASFAQRRKTLLNGLSSAFGSQYSKEDLRQIISSCGLPEDIRGERLGIPEFAALTNIFVKR